MKNNNDLQDMFLKDIAYGFMIKQFENNPETQKLLKLFQKHGMDKQQAFAILIDMMDMNNPQDINSGEELKAAVNRVFNKVAQVERKIDRLDYKLDSTDK